MATGPARAPAATPREGPFPRLGKTSCAKASFRSSRFLTQHPKRIASWNPLNRDFCHKAFQPIRDLSATGLFGSFVAKQDQAFGFAGGDNVLKIRSRFPLHSISRDDRIDARLAKDLLGIRNQQKPVRQGDFGNGRFWLANYSKSLNIQLLLDALSQVVQRSCRQSEVNIPRLITVFGRLREVKLFPAQ